MRTEGIYGSLKKERIPSKAGDHPELDELELLDDREHRKYQMLIGILVWVVTIGCIDIAHATSSLSRFTSAPRKGHLSRLLILFGYLKRRPNKTIIVDSRDPIYRGGENLISKDYMQVLNSMYLDAREELDSESPKSMVDEMKITVFVDSYHAHDKISRRSITGIVIFVGRTPVIYPSKRQGAIECSTYSAEFVAMKTAVEELTSLRYMLRCLGVKATCASLVCGNNPGVIQNVTVSESLQKKKHVAIAYHKVQETTASGIAHPIKTPRANNYVDVLTKSQVFSVFTFLVGGMMCG